MRTTKESKKGYEAVSMMVEILENIGGGLERKEKIDDSHLEAVLTFFEVFTEKILHGKEKALRSRTAEEAETRQGAEARADHEQGRQLVRKMRLALSQYQKGADRAGQEFAKCVRDYVVLLRRHLGLDGGLILPLSADRHPGADRKGRQQETADAGQKSAGPGGQDGLKGPLENMKGIFLVD